MEGGEIEYKKNTHKKNREHLKGGENPRHPNEFSKKQTYSCFFSTPSGGSHSPSGHLCSIEQEDKTNTNETKIKEATNFFIQLSPLKMF